MLCFTHIPLKNSRDNPNVIFIILNSIVVNGNDNNIENMTMLITSFKSKFYFTFPQELGVIYVVGIRTYKKTLDLSHV